MIGATAKADQFRERAGNAATKGSRSGANLLGWGEAETLTPAQQRDALIAAKERLIAEIQATKDRLTGRIGQPDYLALTHKLKPERDAQRARLAAINLEIIRLKPIVKPGKVKLDLGDYLIQMFEESVTKPQWKAIVEEARRRHTADRAGLEA